MPLIILDNQHCASHYTWQPTLCLSLYLTTNIVPLTMLGNPCWTLALCIPLVSPISFSEIQLLCKTMKSLRMVTNGNINEFCFMVTHNWKTNRTPPPFPNFIHSFLIHVSTIGAMQKVIKYYLQVLRSFGTGIKFSWITRISWGFDSGIYDLNQQQWEVQRPLIPV